MTPSQIGSHDCVRDMDLAYRVRLSPASGQLEIQRPVTVTTGIQTGPRNCVVLFWQKRRMVSLDPAVRDGRILTRGLLLQFALVRRVLGYFAWQIAVVFLR
jgi:hypothetical protein